MKVSQLSIGTVLREGRFDVEVTAIRGDKFDVQYISGAIFTYCQIDLDNGDLEYKTK